MTSKKHHGPTGDDDLLDQWSFLDSMIERQASSLRAGAQDPEEDDGAPALTSAGGPEFADLQARVAALEAERDTLRKDLAKARRELKATHAQRHLSIAAAADLAGAQADLAAARAGLESAHAEIVQLRSELERERHLRERGETNSADLMRALREAHADVEDARQAAAAAEPARAQAAPAPPPVPHNVPHPGFDVFDPPKEPPMPTRYEDGPPALSSTDLVRPSADDEPARTSLRQRFFGRRR